MRSKTTMEMSICQAENGFSLDELVKKFADAFENKAFADILKMNLQLTQEVLIHRIFKRFTEIQSPKQIAYELNEDGIRPRTGKLWTSPYISRILANHTYVGEVLFKGEITQGEHEGIITRKVWDRVREITASQVPYDHSQGMAELTTPLKGILRCGHCGCAMKPVFTTKGNKRYCYYYCDQDTKRGEKSCPVGKIGSATIEEAVLEESKKIFKSPYFLEKVSSKTGIPADWEEQKKFLRIE